MATHSPSGTLWIAMAMAMATPTEGSARVATKVAIPSGKLWMAMAMAVSRPIFSSSFFFAASASSPAPSAAAGGGGPCPRSMPSSTVSSSWLISSVDTACLDPEQHVSSSPFAAGAAGSFFSASPLEENSVTEWCLKPKKCTRRSRTKMTSMPTKKKMVAYRRDSAPV